MASHDVWLDFENLRHRIRNNTVDRLKQILSGLNEECGIHISKSGKKQEIIDRIVQTLDSWRQANAVEKWTKAKAVLYQVNSSGTYTPSRASSSSGLHSTNSISSPMYSSSIGKPSYNASGSSSADRYDPYAARKLSGSISVPTAPSTSSLYKSAASKQPGLRFKDSPFFRVDQMVSNVVECPESGSATDRRSQVLLFTLNNQQIDKLKAENSKYQLRLFCTSSTFYSSNSSLRAFNAPCPIEFPPTCEVRVNNAVLSTSLKGLKKKPGTAPPPDLGKYIRISATQNRIEMVYVNSQQPAQSKKYFLVVQLVETTSVTALVHNLKSNCYQTAEEIRKQMQASIAEDDDIIAGPQKMSLKCPLTLLRVNIPCRSSKCVHRQCFDAMSWFSVNEQTTTWLCPVCEQVLDTNDLVIDGFFENILKDCPDSVEDVMVEADGEWHTSDNKYGSLTWKMKHPPEKPKSSSPRKPSLATPVKGTTPSAGSSLPNGDASKKPAVEITILDDSDDEDEGRVKLELSPSFGVQPPSTVPQTQSSQDEIIDLTLDSDDEEPPRPPVRSALKRKVSEAGLSPTEAIWKKGRVDSDNTPISSTSANPHSSRVPSLTANSSASSSSASVRYPPAYDNGPQVSSMFGGGSSSSFGRNPASGGPPQLPPLTRNYPGYQSTPQVNGTSNHRWP
ncbi:hypothetical protein K435DRAFT_267523 [Dendrothele bispora CBS 962.96]|uniref:Zf-MIZ-domain-containing protein n=1 Tax=Dendrothele bispora (strain CBS 962.96) TaxID=1314807 RepID=A0A4S8MYC2_DENBC|nr:hypothetical protein K435DRAFT_267523 [Dendrothele bispora CBS 962.96]